MHGDPSRPFLGRKWLALLALLALACSGANGAEPPPIQPRSEEPAPEPPPEPEPAVSPTRAEPDPDSACGRALACCRAYASAVPDVVESSACAGVFEAAETGADARCDAMKEGWRQVLTHLSDGTDDCP